MSSKGDKPGFAEWIGLKSELDFGRAKWLGGTVGALLALIALAVVLGGLAALVQFLYAVFQINADHEAVRNIGLVLAAVFGAPFIFWRALVAQKQADTAEQSHITDQINKAVAGLGADKKVDRIGRVVGIGLGNEPSSTRSEFEWQGSSLELSQNETIADQGDWQVFSETRPNIEVRIGAIYALERIAQDSLRDHIQIMEILTAYIRQNAPVHNLIPSDTSFYPPTPKPRTDIQAALDVLGRRKRVQIELEHSKKYRLDLRQADLSGANFSKGNFEGALFSKSRLEATDFTRANLRGARMERCLLNYTIFHDAYLFGARLDFCGINKPKKTEGYFDSADITGVSFLGADISALSRLGKSEKSAPTFGSSDTVLSLELDRERKRYFEEAEKLKGTYIEKSGKVDTADFMSLNNSPFFGWSVNNSESYSIYVYHALFNLSVGITGFPFDDD